MTDASIVIYILAIVFIFSGVFNILYPPGFHWLSNGIKLPFATKNQDVYNESNKVAAKLSIVIGCIYSVIGTVLLLVPDILIDVRAIFPATFLFAVLACVFTKTHIDKVFDESGRRKK